MKQGTLAAVVVANLLAMPAAVALDQNLPVYKTASGVAGQLKSVGSDTLGNAMELWVKRDYERYPDVKIAIEDKGSATAPPRAARWDFAIRTDVATDDVCGI
jgi:phosphate transport system substrate-binding protein